MFEWLHKKWIAWRHVPRIVSIANNPYIDPVSGNVVYENWYVTWECGPGHYGTTVGGATAEQAYHMCCTALPEYRWPPFSKVKTFGPVEGVV